jgi:NAD(P)-dependent dehydrogenase (short-subunit alcohol dehydrogenase family)
VLVAVLVAVLAVWKWWNAVDLKEFYSGKRIIVTGSSRGLGREMAIQLAQLGARLVVTARSDALLSETVKECHHHTPDVHMVVADIGSEVDCVRLVDEAVELLGGVDVLILNAAYTPEPEWFSSDNDVTRKFLNAFRVNVMQAVYLTQAALPHLTASQGSIIAISSGAAIAGIPKLTPYGTSKHALQGFFKTLHQEFVMTAVPVSISIIPLPYILHSSTIHPN